MNKNISTPISKLPILLCFSIQITYLQSHPVDSMHHYFTTEIMLNDMIASQNNNVRADQ